MSFKNSKINPKHKSSQIKKMSHFLKFSQLFGLLWSTPHSLSKFMLHNVYGIDNYESAFSNMMRFRDNLTPGASAILENELKSMRENYSVKIAKDFKDKLDNAINSALRSNSINSQDKPFLDAVVKDLDSFFEQISARNYTLSEIESFCSQNFYGYSISNYVLESLKSKIKDAKLSLMPELKNIIHKDLTNNNVYTLDLIFAGYPINFAIRPLGQSQPYVPPLKLINGAELVRMRNLYTQYVKEFEKDIQNRIQNKFKPENYYTFAHINKKLSDILNNLRELYIAGDVQSFNKKSVEFRQTYDASLGIIRDELAKLQKSDTEDQQKEADDGLPMWAKILTGSLILTIGCLLIGLILIPMLL